MKAKASDRRFYIGGSDARIIMGRDEAALLRLWREKRGEVEPKDLSRDLLVQFGCATEALNRRWFELETGRQLNQVQRFARHPRVAVLSDVEDAYACASGADALVIVTEGDLFRALDLDRLRDTMNTPVLVDLRSIYNPAELARKDFIYIPASGVAGAI